MRGCEKKWNVNIEIIDAHYLFNININPIKLS